jgi:hypothetical protein
MAEQNFAWSHAFGIRQMPGIHQCLDRNLRAIAGFALYAAFSFFDLLVVIIMIAVLAALFPAALISRTPKLVRRTESTFSNLGLATWMFFLVLVH